jgi:hypothetical protein
MYYNLATTARTPTLRLNRHEVALANHRRALALKPDHVVAKMVWAALRKLGRYDARSPGSNGSRQTTGIWRESRRWPEMV